MSFAENDEEVKEVIEPDIGASIVLWCGSREWMNTFIGNIITFETSDEAQKAGNALIRFFKDNPEALAAYRGFSLPEGAKDKVAFIKGILKKTKEPVEREPREYKSKRSTSK